MRRSILISATRLGLLVGLLAIDVAGADAADLPRQHRTTHPRRPFQAEIVIDPLIAGGPPRPAPAAGLPVLSLGGVISPPPNPCFPGYVESAQGTCLRHGELKVVCDREGHDCHPVPPDPLPYKIGPYLRLYY